MCEFISWVEKGGKVYFLTGKQVFQSREGKALREYCANDSDLCGHGAIRSFYSLEGGKNREMTDFSSPANFPSEIVAAIKAGDMRGMGIALALLSQPAGADYKRIEQAARVDYQRIEQAAGVDYQRIEQAARVDYHRIAQAAFWDLFAQPENRAEAWR